MMGWRLRRFHCLLWGVLACSACGFYLVALMPITAIEQCNCGPAKDAVEPKRDGRNTSEHKLAVLVPFRDRFEELLTFVPYMHTFLAQQRVDHHIYVLNQVDQYRFNRASLINVGFLLSRGDHDYIAMHDVDLLPLNPSLSYAYPGRGVAFHVASPDLHPRYHYPNFVGGILLLTREDYESVDGMSNQYWGWGLEDDEFYVRLKEKSVQVKRPANMTTGRENSFRHVHNRTVRRRDMAKCYGQRDATRRRDRRTGLHNVGYKVAGVREVVVDGAKVTVVSVELQCDKVVSPWCDCSDAPPTATTRKKEKEGTGKVTRQKAL